ncbi:MAG: hypothetical protein U0169_04910 [Polyangiaceae bacterium]
MIARRILPVALAALASVLPSAAGAQEGIPSHFVTDSACRSMSPACTCADAPFVEMYLRNQDKAMDAWTAVDKAIATPTGPRSTAQARALFNQSFSGDGRVTARFATCEGYDPAVNSATKIAGVTGVGSASLDPCFCKAFCKDVVEATIQHEVMHPPTLLAGFAATFELQIGCKVGLVNATACTAADARTLARSEIASHRAGNDLLRNAVKGYTQKPDERKPEILCTWQPLPASARRDTTTSAPESLWARVKRIVTKFVHGPDAPPPGARGRRDRRGRPRGRRRRAPKSGRAPPSSRASSSSRRRPRTPSPSRVRSSSTIDRSPKRWPPASSSPTAVSARSSGRAWCSPRS